MMPERRPCFSSFQLVNGFTRVSAGNILFGKLINPETDTTISTYHRAKYSEHKFLEQDAPPVTAKLR
jgi:hypothetical protein